MRVHIICSIRIAYPPSPRCDRHLRPPSRCPDPHAEWHRGACAPKLPSPDLKHCNILIHIYVYICAQSATPSRTRARPRPPTATPATTTPPSATAPKSSPVRPAPAPAPPPPDPSQSESIRVDPSRAETGTAGRNEWCHRRRCGVPALSGAAAVPSESIRLHPSPSRRGGTPEFQPCPAHRPSEALRALPPSRAAHPAPPRPRARSPSSFRVSAPPAAPAVGGSGRPRAPPVPGRGVSGSSESCESSASESGHPSRGAGRTVRVGPPPGTGPAQRCGPPPPPIAARSSESSESYRAALIRVMQRRIAAGRGGRTSGWRGVCVRVCLGGSGGARRVRRVRVRGTALVCV